MRCFIEDLGCVMAIGYCEFGVDEGTDQQFQIQTSLLIHPEIPFLGGSAKTCFNRLDPYCCAQSSAMSPLLADLRYEPGNSISGWGVAMNPPF
jgi:hypothetical protein